MRELAPRIVLDESIAFGKPVVQGTRVPVDLVIGKLGSGMTMEEVADEYVLEREDLLAVLAYASHVLAEDSFLVLG